MDYFIHFSLPCLYPVARVSYCRGWATWQQYPEFKNFLFSFQCFPEQMMNSKIYICVCGCSWGSVGLWLYLQQVLMILLMTGVNILLLKIEKKRKSVLKPQLSHLFWGINININIVYFRKTLNKSVKWVKAYIFGKIF